LRFHALHKTAGGARLRLHRGGDIAADTLSRSVAYSARTKRTR
jgi:hypothetical protein